MVLLTNISPLVDSVVYVRGGSQLNARKEEMQENKENIDSQGTASYTESYYWIHQRDQAVQDLFRITVTHSTFLALYLHNGGGIYHYSSLARLNSQISFTAKSKHK